MSVDHLLEVDQILVHSPYMDRPKNNTTKRERIVSWTIGISTILPSRIFERRYAGYNVASTACCSYRNPWRELIFTEQYLDLLNCHKAEFFKLCAITELGHANLVIYRPLQKFLLHWQQGENLF